MSSATICMRRLDETLRTAVGPRSRHGHESTRRAGTEPRVVVVGGGISGLGVSALPLARAGADVVVVRPGDQVGETSVVAE